MLAFVFQALSVRKPELDSGVYIYAKVGFGDYLGFAAAFGYWMGCCFADAACLILSKSTLGLFFPIFGDGTTPTALVSATALLWGVHFLVLRGVKEAAFINTVATVAKIVPIVIFITIAAVGFQANTFAANFWGGERPAAPGPHTHTPPPKTRRYTASTPTARGRSWTRHERPSPFSIKSAPRCWSPCLSSWELKAPVSTRATRGSGPTWGWPRSWAS